MHTTQAPSADAHQPHPTVDQEASFADVRHPLPTGAPFGVTYVVAKLKRLPTDIAFPRQGTSPL